MMQFQIRAYEEFDSAWEALQHAEACGFGTSIRCDGRNLVVGEREAERLAAAGVEFAYLADRRMPDGTNRIMTVPVIRRR